MSKNAIENDLERVGENTGVKDVSSLFPKLKQKQNILNPSRKVGEPLLGRWTVR